jgi:ABC-type antimicrobial peptide transport system permease subunit
MLGITIGVASITAILALGIGASSIVTNQVEDLGGTTAIVRPGTADTSGLDQLKQIPSQQQFAASTLTLDDVSAISKINEVEAVAPLMILSGAVAGANTAPSQTPIIATSPALQKVNNLSVRDGEFLNDKLIVSTVVIGPQLAIDAFGTEQAIGKTLSIKGSPFTVVGVLSRTNMPINFNGVDFDTAAFITTGSGAMINQSIPQIQQINFRTSSLDALNPAISEVTDVLSKNHLGQADFSVLSGEQVAQPTNRLFTAIVAVTAAIAGISLIVGGVGIMNSMLVGVAERTREIGIRKALGASNRDIIAQFMIESLALSIGGGIAGFALGYAFAYFVSVFLPFGPGFSWLIVGVAAAMSIVVGMLFGFYPALRAARKDPINALRQYD